MLSNIDKVIAVLNSFEIADKILEKALLLSSKFEAILEVVYVHEKSLFGVPDYFRPEDSLGDDIIDKEKIKKEIQKRLTALGSDQKYAILVFVDDTVDRVITQIKEPKQALVVTAFEEKITKKLVKKSDTSFLIIKNDKKVYENIVLPVDLGKNALTCINTAKTIFEQSKMRLLHDYHYVILDEVKQKQKELFEALKAETHLEGDTIEEYFVSEVEFVEELYTIEKHLVEFITAGDFDLTFLYSDKKDFLFSDSVSFALLEMLKCDIFICKLYIDD